MRRSIVLLVLSVACGGENSPPHVSSPGSPPPAKSRALEAGAALLQDKTPLARINTYLDGFHFYNGAMSQQMEAHHYCSKVNQELMQCVIFDGNGEDARLMGVEYVVSRRLFESLAPDERKVWHSHTHEVRSGQLIAPGIPDAAEHELMEELVSTYGKTWHIWHTDNPAHTLPHGYPMLMMGFTADGQLRPELLADRDRRFGVSSEKKREERADIAPAPVVPGANAWEKGEVLQLELSRK